MMGAEIDMEELGTRKFYIILPCPILCLVIKYFGQSIKLWNEILHQKFLFQGAISCMALKQMALSSMALKSWNSIF